MTPLLEASGIARAFNGVPAISDGRITVLPGTVNALCGGNGAGKSTFLNVLMGMLPRDGGTILREGRKVNYASASEALADGMGIITQELSPVPDMTVAENLMLGREPRRGWFVDRTRMNREAQELIDLLRFEIDVRDRMGTLSVARMQLVEIARAIGAMEAVRAYGKNPVELPIAGVDGITDALLGVQRGELMSTLQDANALAQGAIDLAAAAAVGDGYEPQAGIWSVNGGALDWQGVSQQHYAVPWVPVTEENVEALLSLRGAK